MATLTKRVSDLEAWKAAHLVNHVTTGHPASTNTHGHPHVPSPADALTAAEVTMLKVLAGGGGGTTPIPNPPPTPPPDITAPTITNVSASGISTTGATITWTTNEAATGLVKYGTTTATTSTTAAGASGTSHSRTLTGLVPGQLYYYEAWATDASGNPGRSGLRTFTTTASPTLPGAPTSLTATGGNTQATLNWTAPASNGGSAITGNRVYRNGASLIVLGVVTTYLNTGLTNGLTYTYTVATITAVGEGPQSNTASVTPSAGGDINAPVPINIVATVTGQTSAQISWSQLEAGTGQVRYGTSTAYGSTTTLEPSYLTAHSQPISALNPGTLYHFQVVTQDAAGNEGLSSDRTFTTTATPPPPVPSGTIYGSGIGGDSLGNTNVGGAGTFKQYCRFRAEQSSALSTVRFYYLGPPDPGYALGTGGTWRLQVFADDGTSNHFPTGAALATQNVAAAMGAAAGKLITFSSPATLVAGTLYHLIFENTDASPNANYFGVDYWIYGAMPNGSGQINPRFADTDWGHGFYNDPAGPWEARAGYAPVLDIGYANGQHQGMSYGEASYSPGQVGQINGSSLMVRELFTVAGGSRTVTGAGVRLLRQSGSDALTVRLEDSTGTLIDSFTIAAASIATGPAPYLGSVWDDLGRNAKWVTGSFASPRVLANGATYRLRLSTASGTTYWAWVNRRLSHGYGYSPVTAFTSGNAEKTTNGSTWTSLGRAAGENDLQFYLSLA